MPLRQLCPELAEKAKLELNEDPKTIETDIQHIKDWLAKQPHLKVRTDDQWLLAFIRGCKHSLERTKEKLDLFYTLRTVAPEIYKVKHNDPLFNTIMDFGSYLILPKLEKPDSPRIALIRPAMYDPNKYSFFDIFSSGAIFQNILMYEDDAIVISGLTTLIDLEGVTMGHLLQITPSVMKKMVVYTQDALPIRMKGIHYINTPPGFETIFNAIKLLLNEKNRNRLYVHNKNYNELYKHISQEVLPAEYGGKGGSIQEIKGYWKSKIEECSLYLEEDLTNGTDESKRPGKPNTSESLFGLEGSFQLAKKAKEELNEDPKNIQRDLQHIKDWLSKQPHLKARLDDQWLVAFLRGCKYSLERTKEKLDLYYSMRSLAPELFRVKATDSAFDELISLGTYLILPKTATPDSPRIIIIRAGSYDPAKYNFIDIFSATSHIQKILISEDDATIVSGFKTIMDMEGITLAHLMQITPSIMKKMAVLSQLYVHNNNFEELYKHIPKEILPNEYGGNGGSIKEITEYWKAKVQEYSSWLEDDLKYGSDESKRVGKPRTAETLFGVEGSFRQLEFD
ncbi:unnamed protein product [Danaus chrysippus]|uniref:(African queen) hypothetical protein n=1 Tax=Danaus chrysippus TaxID=151541 RepID=A0A8J2VT14_9NEOP|nr:unnamed protein product [Danaus chrysippus]